jgi:hypothetical protein
MRIKSTYRFGCILLFVTSLLLMSNMSRFSDPAVGADVTFTSCTAGTILNTSNTGQATYTFSSSDCDGNGFTAINNATGTSGTNTCRILISAVTGINDLRFDRSNVAVSVTNAQLKSTSGARFKLTNLEIFPVNAGNQTFTIIAYASGTMVSGSTITSSYTSTTPIHGTTFTSTDFGTHYNNIDEIQVSTNLIFGLAMTDIQTTTPVVLPVTLESFTGQAQGNAIVLNWATAQEINNAYFEVERRGSDGSWTNIGKVEGHGTTALPENYSFTDNTPLNGTDFYRLQQVDLDGNSVYSNVVVAETSATATNAALAIFPNPVQSSMNITLNHDQQETAVITVRDLSGAVVLSTNQALSKGFNNLTINGLFSLAQGTYIVSLVTPTTHYTSKFLKSR